jgi:polyisoprenoid-binding protein YceI
MTARYQIDPGRSRFTVQAFATGMLSLFAHSPTFAVGEFAGQITLDDTVETLRLEVTVSADSLVLVDKVSAADRQEIESRMRREVLETGAYPQITLQAGVVRSERVAAGQYRLRLSGPMSLHGVTHPVEIDAELSVYQDGVRLRGEFPLRLSDYRIRPVTALGGAIKLRDELNLSFDVSAFPEGT